MERHKEDGRKLTARLLDKMLRPKTLGDDQARTLIYLLSNELLNFNDGSLGSGGDRQRQEDTIPTVYIC